MGKIWGLEDKQIWEDAALCNKKASNSLRVGICVHWENSFSSLIWRENMQLVLGKCELCVPFTATWIVRRKEETSLSKLLGLDLESPKSKGTTSLPHCTILGWTSQILRRALLWVTAVLGFPWWEKGVSSRERSILGCATLPKGGQENNLAWLKKEAFSERKAHRDRGSKIRIGVHL